MRTTPIPAPPPLTDGVITLRTRVAADVPLQVEAGRDPETVRWLDDTPPPPDALIDVEDRLRRTAARFASGEAATLTIADEVSDEPLGVLNVQFRDDRLATLAYSVFPMARGRGIAARAVALAETWAFGALGLTELRLEIDPDNAASLRVAAKLGWSELEGVRSDRGELVFSRRG